MKIVKILHNSLLLTGLFFVTYLCGMEDTSGAVSGDAGDDTPVLDAEALQRQAASIREILAQEASPARTERLKAALGELLEPVNGYFAFAEQNPDEFTAVSDQLAELKTHHQHLSDFVSGKEMRIAMTDQMLGEALSVVLMGLLKIQEQLSATQEQAEKEDAAAPAPDGTTIAAGSASIPPIAPKVRRRGRCCLLVTSTIVATLSIAIWGIIEYGNITKKWNVDPNAAIGNFTGLIPQFFRLIFRW
jgi:hypothetical protein